MLGERMNWYTIGSFTFPASWAAIVISFLLTGIILRLLFKKQNIVDLYGNAVFIFIIIWKLSIVIFDFKTTISNPMTIVYFHGGLKGYWLGIMTVCIYLIYICYKKHCFYQEKAIMVFAWMMTVSIYWIVKWICVLARRISNNSECSYAYLAKAEAPRFSMACPTAYTIYDVSSILLFDAS